ncbi:MAG TPA: metallophosphoesterase [Egibacteraceae bacterium]|nr:metallophosphoesterase [Egibacteraceae bacterium]
MVISHTPLRIAQVSDIHCGTVTFDAKLMQSVVERVNGIEPDLVVVVGDLTASGYEWEFEEAARWIGSFDAPAVVLPGNHDARNIGYLHFQRRFGERFSRYRQAFEPQRAERLRASGVTLVGVDSSEPDMNDGHIGREWYDWIRDQFSHPDDVKVFAIHHHLVSIPGTGRERNTVTDAGDLLEVLADLELDIVLSGHKHVPFFWGLNGILICNSATPSTRRVRGLTPPSWNELQVDASTIKVFLHYEDGRRELAVIRTRANRVRIREALYVTDDFRTSNPRVTSAETAGGARTRP